MSNVHPLHPAAPTTGRAAHRPPHRPGLEPLWRDVLGEQMRELRLDRGDRLTDVADRAGLSPQYLSEVERGVKDPSSEVVAALAGALEIDVVDLTAMAVTDLRRRQMMTAKLPAPVRERQQRPAGPVALAA